LIYPTRRAIYLLLAGAPMALALGLVRPELWLVAPGWIGVILACLVVDCVAGANPRHLGLDARVSAPGRGRRPVRPVKLAATGGRGAAARRDRARARRTARARAAAWPATCVKAADAGRHSDAHAAAHRLAPRAGADRGAVASLGRAARARLEAAPKFALDRAIAVVPSLRAVTDEGSRLFQRNSWFGLRQQQLPRRGQRI
jgi:hypothetical protein